MRHRPPRSPFLAAAALAAGTLLSGAAAAATTPADLLAAWRAAAGGAEPSAQRGQQLFTSRHGREWSCASCHGNPPTGTGQHAGTGKPIQPLAPAAHPQRFTDAGKAEKWLRRNCNDVIGRECSAGEKADLLTWLMTLPR